MLQRLLVPKTVGPREITVVTDVHLCLFLVLSFFSSPSLFSCLSLSLSFMFVYLSSPSPLVLISISFSALRFSLFLSFSSFTTLFLFPLALSSLSVRISQTCPENPECTGLGPFVEWRITRITQKDLFCGVWLWLWLWLLRLLWRLLWRLLLLLCCGVLWCVVVWSPAVRPRLF